MAKDSEKTTAQTASQPPEPVLALADYIRLYNVPPLQAAVLRVHDGEKHTAQEWGKLLEALLKREAGGRS